MLIEYMVVQCFSERWYRMRIDLDVAIDQFTQAKWKKVISGIRKSTTPQLMEEIKGWCQTKLAEGEANKKKQKTLTRILGWCDE